MRREPFLTISAIGSMGDGMTAISELIDTDFARADADDTVASTIGALMRDGGVLVFEGDELLGTLSTRKITRTRLDPAETKVRGLITHPPILDEDDDLLRAAQLMIDSDLAVLPVGRKGHVAGVARAPDVLAALGLAIESNLVARDVMSRPVETIGPDELLSKAAAMFKRKDISRLPVVENGTMIGLLTVADVIGNLLNHNPSDIFLLDEHQAMLNTPVRNAMQTSFATEHPDSPLSGIADRMSGGIATVILTTEGDPEGMITQRDLIEAFLVSDGEATELAVHVACKDPELDQDRAREELAGFADKHREHLGVGTITATLEKQRETHKGLSHVTTKLRILTDLIGISAIGDGWGEAHSVRDALRKAETQLMR